MCRLKWEISIRLPWSEERVKLNTDSVDVRRKYEALHYADLERQREFARAGLRLAAESGSLAAWWHLDGRWLYQLPVPA